MKKSNQKVKKKSSRKNKKAATSTENKFRFSSTTGNLLPLHTLRQRLSGIWTSLTWPICVKILKANIAVTIALSFLLIEPIRNIAGTSAILASVAVEFVHPAKSYGFLAEDVLFGSVMCSISAAWSILGIFLASLVRDPSDPAFAQPKVEQANVGGMLSATIMVISLTSAVSDRQFTATPTLQVYIPTLVGFALIFTCFLVIFPENSTLVFVQHLIKVFETFDGITQRQIITFLRVSSASVVDSSEDSIANIHVTIEDLITTLIQKKRMVRREPSYNCIAPTDVSELTSLIKSLRIPLQGLGLSRAMEKNMRKAEKTVFRDLDSMRQSNPDADITDILSNTDHADPTLTRPRSYYGGTDDEEDEDDDDDEYYGTTDDDISNMSSPRSASSAVNSTANSSTSSLASQATTQTHSTRRRRNKKIRWEDSMKVMTYWRQDYDDILNIVKPTYLELTDACSVAVHESVKRLRHMQCLDVRFENKPFFYKYYYCWKVGKEQEQMEGAEYEYNHNEDPSIPLFQAMQRFHEHRLVGLEKLYTKSGVPRRILFLLLTFQFNLHSYAESIYTLTSLIYELDQVRVKRKFWWPHMPLSKWLFHSHKSAESFELETPAAIVNINQQASTLQRTLTRRATLQKADLEKNDRMLYRLDTPHRGRAHSPKEHHNHHPYDFQERPSASKNIWRQNILDPLEYHDPDVAYPTTSTQRFFYKIYQFLVKHLYTADFSFSIRAAVVVACLTLPAFLEESYHWYNEIRAQWAAVVALIWMGPSVGSNFFGTMTRTIGTFIGAVEAIIIWEISRGSVPGLIVLTFFCNLPWWMIYINGKFWKATGLFSLITISLIIGYTYSYRPNGKPVSVYVVAWERTVDVLIGVLAALIVSIFPYPRTGRVVLRHRISQSLAELGALYSSFLSLLLKNAPEDELTKTNNRKLFRSVASSIRAQIKGERVLLEQSRFEPALRGVFPENKYLHILQILDNILSLMLVMEFSLEKTDPKWRMMIVQDTWKERKEMISSFLIALHLGSSSLTSKAPLPPYVLRPTKARRNLTNRTRKLKALKYQYLGEREYTYFSTYLMNSEQLAVEIELLIATIRDLVGPDSVSIWLNYKH